MNERYIASIDLGTSKVALCVAKIEDSACEIIYNAQKPSDGIRHGRVFNPTRAAVPVMEIIKEAEDELGIKILQVVTGLPRYYVRQESAPAKIERSDPAFCIRQEEVDSLKEMALDSYPLDDTCKEEIYGAVIQSFSAEDMFQVSERDVVGVQSDILEGNYKIFIGSKKASDNLDTMMNKTGVAIARKYFLPDITAKAVLTKEEMSNGVALLEIGAGISSVTIYQNSILRFYGSIPFGGQNITADIKNECGFTTELAENIKLAFGACMPEKLQSMSDKMIQINNDEDGSCPKLPVKYLSEIITCRVREITEALLYLIESSGYADRLRNGIVLTGGCSELVNCGNYVKELSGYNVRIGFPRTKYICTSGCNGLNETSAVSTLAMIMEAREDAYLNCISGEMKKTDIPDLKGTVFEMQEEQQEAPALSEDMEKEKKKKKEKAGHGKITWAAKLKTSLEGTLFNLYDDMQ